MYLKSFFRLKSKARAVGFTWCSFGSDAQVGTVSSRALGWAEPRARGWVQPRLKQPTAPQQASHCVTQYNQGAVSVCRQHEFPLCCWCDILDRNGVNSSYLPTWERVSVAKLFEGLGAVINYTVYTPASRFWECHGCIAYSLPLLTSLQ